MNIKKTTKINFEYAFAEPHRLCICKPESSRKTLLDATKTQIIMSWADGDTRKNPLGAYLPLHTDWKVVFTAQVDGQEMHAIKWHRIENWIPAFYYVWEEYEVRIQVRIVATTRGDVMHISASNLGTKSCMTSVFGSVVGNVINTKWLDFEDSYSICTPIWGDRGDRMVLMDSRKSDTVPKSRENVDVTFTLPAGETRETYFIRPYLDYLDKRDDFLATDWEKEIEKGLDFWREQLKAAPFMDLPDPIVEDAYKANLADIFVMREEQADGRIAGLAGTEMYRAANTGEPCFQASALCKSGYFQAARDNIDFVAQFQEEDGNWEDEKQWGRLMWSASGWKSYCIREYYLHTRDKVFLEQQFERMLASSRWSQKQRDKTKILNSKDSPEWGLMPRGMGDCGLLNGNDLFGVFYPHNFIHCFGLEIAAWAAKELGRKDVYDELHSNYKDLYDCLHKSLEIGCIVESDGSKWIPGAPCVTTGSRWGVADAIFPTGIVDKNSDLAAGTMNKLQGQLSEGGLPINLGWIKGGLWVAIALDAMAYVNIIRGETDLAAQYFYAALNHGTPFFTWCEERSPEKGSTTLGGDLEHAWTPICIARFTRDMLVMEDFDENTLYLTRAVPRWWYDVGYKIEVKYVPTFYGGVSFYVMRQSEEKIKFRIQLNKFQHDKVIKLQLRLTDIGKCFLVESITGAIAIVEKDCIVLLTECDLVEGEILVVNIVK